MRLQEHVERNRNDIVRRLGVAAASPSTRAVLFRVCGPLPWVSGTTGRRCIKESCVPRARTLRFSGAARCVGPSWAFGFQRVDTSGSSRLSVVTWGQGSWAQVSMPWQSTASGKRRACARRASAVGLGLPSRGAPSLHDICAWTVEHRQHRSRCGAARGCSAAPMLFRWVSRDCMEVLHTVGGIRIWTSSPQQSPHSFSLGRRCMVVFSLVSEPRAYDQRAGCCCGGGNRPGNPLGQVFGGSCCTTF